MRRFLQLLLLSVLLAASTALAETPPDAKGSKDYPAFERFPGCYIDGYDDRAFDTEQFKVMKGKSSEKIKVEGKYFKITYKCPRELKYSSVQVIRNYGNAVKQAGGAVLYEETGFYGNEATFHFKRAGRDTWAKLSANLEISGSPPQFSFTVIEKELMEQVVTADGMTKGLRADGKIALYGIYFDTGKSEVKAESDPTLAEIAKALAADASLKVWVVGHTDMAGDAAANQKLSEDRAAAVVSALTSKHGVAAGRLAPKGVGPYAPVATNRTEEGRKLNRRVELVDQSVK